MSANSASPAVGPAAHAGASSDVSASKIHVLGLGPLKARLAGRWGRMAAHVQLFFEAAIRRELGPGDTFYRTDELTYLLVFPALTPAEVQLKCAVIAEDVCRRLFGENGEEVLVRNLVGQVDHAAAKTIQTSSAAVDEMLEKNGQEVFVSKDGSRSRQDEARKVPPVKLKLRFSNRVEAVTLTVPTDLSFAYRPIWDISKQAVYTYLCQPVPNSVEIDRRDLGLCLATESEDAQMVFDTFLLRECANRMHKLGSAGLRVLLAVPIHFHTVARPRLWSAYERVYREILPSIGRDLAFMVHGIEDGVPNIRLVQEFPKLSLDGHRLFCAVDRPDVSVAQFANTGVHAVGFCMRSRTSTENEAIDTMKLFAQTARKANITSFVIGVESKSLTLNGIEAGLRYMEGSAIRAPGDPRHPFLYTLEDLYSGKPGRPAA